MAELIRQKKAHELFTRYKGNPILKPENWPYPANAVFNPAAVKLNTETLLLIRVEDMRGFSHLTVARSANGLTDWEIDPKPTLGPTKALERKNGASRTLALYGSKSKSSSASHILPLAKAVQ